MKLKRLATFVATFAISAIGYSLISNASASAATLTWNKPDGDNFCQANNWTPEKVPASGDALIFPANVQGDMKINCAPKLSSISFASGSDITFTASNENSYVYTDDLQITGSASVIIDYLRIYERTQGRGGIFIAGGGNLVVDNTLYQESSELIVGSYSGTAGEMNFFGKYVGVDADGSGGGEMITLSGGVTMRHEGTEEGSSPVFMVVSEESTLDIDNPKLLGTGETSIDEGSTLIMSKGFSTSKNVVFGNGAQILASDGGNGSEITLSGRVGIYNQSGSEHASAKAVYNSSSKVNLKLTGDVLGGKIVPADGSMGSVIVSPASGKTNSSQTPNGETKPATKTVTITDQNTDYVDVFGNNVVIINGKRGEITVHPGGILKGKGTVGILDVLSGGRVAPGESPGILNAGNTTFESGAFFEAEIGGATVGTEYDQLKVAGTVSLGGATLDTKLINGFKPKANDAFTIIDNDGTDAITGTFKDLPEGATFTLDGVVFKISYVGGDGNDVVLTIQSVPSTPNTGMQLLASNPLLTLTLTTLSAGTLFVLARKYNFAGKR